ncbi:MAG: 4Fe-4S dicluster domain-containing protein [Actinobacteria bacterium]|nr:4Fe-4S dicluster domain-containing protein [Actinomycetota bacterium]
MGEYKFSYEKLPEVVSGLKEYRVYGPVKEEEGEVVRYKLIDGNTKMRMGAGEGFSNSNVPPKELMFPETETLFKFHLGEGKLEEPSLDDKRVILGIRPCDAQAYSIVDNLFGWDFADPYYQKRRENTVLVGLACSDPCSNCFCPSLGGGPAEEKNLDAIMFDLGDILYLKTLTGKGEELAAALSGVIESAGEAEKSAAEKQAGEALDKIKRSIDTDGIPEKLPSLYNHPMWEQFSDRCLGCGICTFLCPTCHCFDIQDEVECFDARRARMWDSCMFSEYTVHASGHNPRPTRKQRTRNRISHKYSYFPEKFETIACVGCGRCINYCPVNIDILDILEKTKKAQAKEEKTA